MFKALQLADEVFLEQNKWQTFLTYRAIKAHLSINLRSNSSFVDLLILLCNRNEKIGYRNVWNRWGYTRYVLHDTNIYRAQNYLNLFKKHLQPYHADRQKRIVLMPGAGGVHKRWALQNYIRLAEKLQHAYPRFEIAFVLGAQEHDLERSIRDAGLRCHNDLELSDLFTFIKSSSLVIANDCGPSHIAQIYMVPTIVLHSDETLGAAATIREWFHSHDASRAIIGKAGKSIDTIQVDRVLDAACKLLGGVLTPNQS